MEGLVPRRGGGTPTPQSDLAALCRCVNILCCAATAARVAREHWNTPVGIACVEMCKGLFRAGIRPGKVGEKIHIPVGVLSLTTASSLSVLHSFWFDSGCCYLMQNIYTVASVQRKSSTIFTLCVHVSWLLGAVTVLALLWPLWWSRKPDPQLTELTHLWEGLWEVCHGFPKVILTKVKQPPNWWPL